MAVLVVAAWVTTGLFVVMLCRWLDALDFELYSESPDPMLVLLGVVFWPFCLVTALGIAAVKVTARAKERRESIRAEAEREMERAKREVEEFLRSCR